MVNSIRIKMPQIGTRKLYFILQEKLQLLNIGRDKLFRILKENHRITDSHHRFRKHKQKPLIHHSDRGLQYCSNEYQKILIENHIKPSITQQYDPYENAVGERVNGILKQEFGIDKYDMYLDSKIKLVKNIVKNL